MLGGEGSGGADSVSFEADLLSSAAGGEVTAELLTAGEALGPERFRPHFNCVE